EVHKMLLDGRVLGLGIPHNVPRLQKDGVFNYDQFKSFAQYELGLTPGTFIEEQQRELLASRMRELLRAGVTVSAEEVKADFEMKNRQVNLEYVRFPSRKFEADAEPTTEEIATYVKANDAKLKELYEQRKHMYTDLQPEVRLRQILVKAALPPPPAEKKE